MQGLQLSFHCPAPRVLWSASFAFAVWCPVKGSSGDVVLLSTCDMPNPLPSPSNKDGNHVFLFTQAKKVLVGYCFGPEYSLNFP